MIAKGSQKDLSVIINALHAFAQECICSRSKYSNFEILNKDYCICALESHMTINKELQSQIEDKVSINDDAWYPGTNMKDLPNGHINY